MRTPGRKGHFMDISKKPPVLSRHAKNLLLLAEKGTPDLVQWYVGIWQSWGELAILNELYGGGCIKYRWGRDVFLVTLDGTYFPDGEKTVLHRSRLLEDGKLIEEELKIDICYEYKYAYGASSLFKCFFKVFPAIDLVDTEKISGLGFPNPFSFLHDPDEDAEGDFTKIAGKAFFKRAKACEESPEFLKRWEELKPSESNENDFPHYSVRGNKIFRQTALYLCPNMTHLKTQSEAPGKCEECGLEKYIKTGEPELFDGQILSDTLQAIWMKFQSDKDSPNFNERELIGHYESANPDQKWRNEAKEMLSWAEAMRKKQRGEAPGGARLQDGELDELEREKAELELAEMRKFIEVPGAPAEPLYITAKALQACDKVLGFKLDTEKRLPGTRDTQVVSKWKIITRNYLEALQMLVENPNGEKDIAFLEECFDHKAIFLEAAEYVGSQSFITERFFDKIAEKISAWGSKGQNGTNRAVDGEEQIFNEKFFEIAEAAKVYSFKMGNEIDHITKGKGSICLCNLITDEKAKHGLTVDQVRNQSTLIESREAQEGQKTNVIDEVLSQSGRQEILKRIEFLGEKEKDAGVLTEEEEIEKDALIEELGKATHQGKIKKVFTGIQETKNKERESTQTAIKRALKEFQNRQIKEYLENHIEFKSSLFYYNGEPFEITTTE